MRLSSLAALVGWPFRSVCLSCTSTFACGCWPRGFSLRTSSLVVPACVCRSFLGWRSCVFFLSCSARGRLLLSLLRVLLLCLFLRRVLPQVTLRGLSNLSGSSCLSCSCGGALFVGFAVSLVRRLVFYLVPCSFSGACSLRCLPCRRFPLGVSAFSDTVCLTYCCAGGVGWAATLPLCYQCFSCAGWLAGVHWVLHPVSGSSHRGCDCSLDDSVVVLFDSTCL